jgi:hypothetical protein
MAGESSLGRQIDRLVEKVTQKQALAERLPRVARGIDKKHRINAYVRATTRGRPPFDPSERRVKKTIKVSPDTASYIQGQKLNYKSASQLICCLIEVFRGEYKKKFKKWKQRSKEEEMTGLDRY